VVKPQAIGILLSNGQQPFRSILKDINKKYGDGFVDKVHDHVRLHNSVNSWIDFSGNRIDAMNIKVSVAELFTLMAEDIFKKARALARTALNS
jgi:hypothetical protein